MHEYKVSFSRPSMVGNELEYISDALKRMHISGDGHYTKKCHQLLEEILGVQKCLLTTSCTHALEMCAILLNVREGDEVIVPSFTFVSSINAFVLHGARPVFVDVREDTLNLDERLLSNAINDKTRAIVPVHYAGVGCEMDTIMEIANRANVTVVEDNALGLFASYKGKFLGTFGSMATQSFHETKNIICGEGGALLINDDDFSKRAEILREKGTNRSQFFRGEVDKYSWVDVGSSYLPSDLLAAFLLAQLEQRADIQSKRRAIWERYNDELADWARANGIRQPTVPAHCEQSHHMYYILLPNEDVRTRLIAHLKARSVHAVFHYLPLNTSRMGERFGASAGDCPVTESVSGRLLRLPFFNNMTVEEQGIVIEALHEFEV